MNIDNRGHADAPELGEEFNTESAQTRPPWTFILDPEELKTGLVIFRRGDVKHRSGIARSSAEWRSLQNRFAETAATGTAQAVWINK
ncbi:MAG TPA: hypothetical protein VMF86_15330 [Stellaceae bacterium]|nr:hypothetical protein [Stellaceae bacterium]